MEIEAPAKINLWLRVLGRRDDGFHEIESLFVPISLADTLRVERRAEPGVEFSCSDASLPVDSSNLVVRAAEAFFREHPQPEGVRIFLEKRIPHGAGLGGGSSDAAATLRAMNEIFDARVPGGALSEMAAELGSDVPFFLNCGAAICRGRGEKVEPCDAPALSLLLIKPPFAVPTPWAYQRWQDSRELSDVPYAAQEFPWGRLVNDLERPVFEKFIFLAALKKWLIAQPEVEGALMSGSGSTMFAVLKGDEKAIEARALGEFGQTMWTWVGRSA